MIAPLVSKKIGGAGRKRSLVSKKSVVGQETLVNLAAPRGFGGHYTIPVPIPELIIHPGWKSPTERGYLCEPSEIVRLKASGKRFIDIAIQLGIPVPTTRRLYYEGTGAKPAASPRYACDPNEIVRLRAAGKTFKEIGLELNVAERTVYRRFRQVQDAGKLPLGVPEPVRRLAVGQIEAILKMKSEGKSVKDIMLAVNVSRGTVVYHLQRPSINCEKCDPEEVS